jgi:LPS-assembly protein
LCLALCAGAAGAQTSQETEAPALRGSAAEDAAQQPEAGSGDVPGAAEAPEDAAPTAPPSPPPVTDCSQGCLNAESQGGGEGHYWARGYVDFQAGDLHIQSDQFDLYEQEDEQGASTRRLVAVGNVVFMRGPERIAGDRLEMDLLADTAVLENARGFVQPEVFIEARRIERVDSRTYRIEGGRFTSCYQPNPRWSFSASSAVLKRDDRISATNVVFRVKSVPTLYLPYFYYPIKDDQRATGLLFPRFGFSSFRGFNVGTGFFWAMSRNTDQTFSVDYYSRFGIGYGHELRYVGLGPTNGTFGTTLFQRSDIDKTDYDITWRAAQDLPGSFRGTLNARLYSSTAFQQRYQDTLNLASSRSQRASLSISGRLGRESLQLVADHNETLFGVDRSRVIQRLPSLRLSRSPRRIGGTGIVFGYETRVERLARGDQDGSDPYQRFDVAPSLSRPWATSFLQIEPSIALRYTRYGATLDDEGGLDGGAFDRRLFEGNVEMRGPNFSKVFSLGGFYSPRFKHEIGPELLWTYRSGVEDFDAIPRFDGVDQLLGTNQFRYGLVQRLLAKRPNRAGKLLTQEVLFWRLSQTYFAQIADNQAEFDPNFSSSFYGPTGEPSHYSPLQSRVRFRPAQSVRANFDAEYDVNFKQMRTLGLSLELGGTRGSLAAGWSRAARLSDVPEERVPIRSTLRGSGQLDLMPGIDLLGAVDYDFIEKSLIRWSARARLGVQCCGLMLELVNFSYNGRDERQFRFALELANIGSFGFDGQPGQR